MGLISDVYCNISSLVCFTFITYSIPENKNQTKPNIFGSPERFEHRDNRQKRAGKEKEEEEEEGNKKLGQFVGYEIGLEFRVLK